MINVQNLTKRYDTTTALEDVSFSVEAGEVLGFLGPNGAGKTTTMRMLTGYIPPTTGKAIVAGFDVFEQPVQAKRRTGYLPETPPLYPDMTPRSILRFSGELQGMSSAEIDQRMRNVIELCRLESVLGKPIGKLSKGFCQRVGMARVLLHEPDVLIMDEPTAGLDPNQIREVRNTLRHLGKTKTILISTHILQEVEPTCTRVLFIDEGRLVFDGTPAELKADEKNLDERFHQITSVES